MDRCKNNTEKFSTAKVGENIPSGFRMYTILSFKGIKVKYDKYRGEDCPKKFCELFKKHQKNLKDNLLVQEKIIKNAKPVQFQQKKKLEKSIKMEKNYTIS